MAENYSAECHRASTKPTGLSLKKEIDGNGDGGYAFSVHDVDLTNWKLFCDSPDHPGIDLRALYVLVRSNKIYAIKAWLFEKFKIGDKPIYSYKGKLPENIGLGDPVSKLLKFTRLEFDDAEELLIAAPSYGGLEIDAYGVSLEDEPEQIIMALAVVEP